MKIALTYLFGVGLILLSYSFDYFPMLIRHREVRSNPGMIGDAVWIIAGIIEESSFYIGLVLIFILSLSLIYKRIKNDKVDSNSIN